METCTLSEFKVQEFMGVELVELKLGGDGLYVLAGQQESGKSSVLRAFKLLVEGAEQMPSRPVRGDADKSTIEAKFSNGDYAKGTIRPDGSLHVVVKDKDGKLYPTPAKMLKAMTNPCCMDPEEWRTMAKTEKGRREQAEIVRTVLGLDWKTLDAQRKAIFDERTNVNRDIKRLEGQLAGMPKQDAPPSEVQAEQIQAVIEDMAPLTAELEKANQQLRQLDSANAKAEKLQSIRLGHQTNIAQTEKQIEKLKAVVASERTALEQTDDLIEEAIKAVKAIVPIPIEPIRQKMQELEAANRKAVADAATANREAQAKVSIINAKVSANKARADVDAQLATAKAESEKYSKEIETIDATKASQLAAAKFPIPGLVFADNGELQLNGVPMDGLSTAQSLTLALNIAMIGNPKLRFVAIDDGGAFDLKTIGLLRQLCAEMKLMIIMTCARQGEETSFVIEAGRVKA